MDNYNNYYTDCNGEPHKDVPIGTSVNDAYVRTNVKLKNEVKRLDSRITTECREIERNITRVEDAVSDAEDNTAAQIESAVGNIERYINEVSGDIGTRMTCEISGVNSRIDNIIAQSGSTEGNSELTDIRTATDGTVYASAGSAVRGQIQKLANALEYIQPLNKFNSGTVSENYSIYETGTLVQSEGNFTSDYIPCSGGQVFYFSRKVGNSFYYSGANVSHFAQYDINKNFIADTRVRYVNNVTLESDTRFIRFSNPLSQLTQQNSILSVTFDVVPTADNISAYFAPYYSVKTSEIQDMIDDIQDNSDSISALNTVIDSQTLEINNIKSLGILTEPENKLDLDNISVNTFINESGNETANDSCFTTGYIKAQKNDVITLTLKNDGVFYHSAVKITRVSMYNENKEFLSASPLFVQDYTVNEDDTAYIRVTLQNVNTDYDNVSLTINNIPTSASISEYFSPYYSCSGVSDETKRSRRVLWLGTSIPSYGYPQILGRLSGATVFNNSVGSSCIAKGVNGNITAANICGIRNISGLYSLTQTVSEKQTMIDNWSQIASELNSSETMTNSVRTAALSSSYETLLDPYLTGDNAADLIVLNHAYNDSYLQQDALCSDDPFDTHTLEGAYNWIIRHIIQTNPHTAVAIFGHYSDLPEYKETALERVAERWNIPYYRLKNDLGWSDEIITTTQKIDTDGNWTEVNETQLTVKNMWCADNIHPVGEASRRIAQVSKPVFDSWLDMYCS